MKLITFNQLKEEKRFPFTRVHTMRLVKANKFPTPLRVGDRHIAWDENEIDAWLENRRVGTSKPVSTHK